MAKPPAPENAWPAEAVASERIGFDRAYIGSCTNGSYEDLLSAALVIHAARARGLERTRKKFVIFPGSGGVRRGIEQAEPRLGGESIASVLRSVGGLIRKSWCGPCFGQGEDALAPGMRAITSFNRNWANRMGRGGEGYLASPAVVAASALLGHIAPPSELGIAWDPERFGVVTVRLRDSRPPLPADRLLVEAAPGPEAVPLDVAIVGGGPAGLAAAIRLGQAARASGRELAVGVFEKAAEPGGHCLSGAVVNPVGFRELFPGMEDAEFPLREPVAAESVHFLTEHRSFRLPTPPTMRNRGCYTGSVSEIARWLAGRAEALGVEIFPGFAAGSLLVSGSGRVLGLRTVAAGLRRDGSPGPGFEPAAEAAARVVILAEGARGPLGQAWRRRLGIPSPNPEIFALGVKELWKSDRPRRG